jgi:hypothetical protein
MCNTRYFPEEGKRYWGQETSSVSLDALFEDVCEAAS